MRKSQQVFCATLFSQHSTENFRIDGRGATVRHHFHKKEFTIGSSKDADLIIRNKAIAPLHLKVTFADNKIFIQKLEAAIEVTVSGRVIEGTNPFPYKSGEVILTGGFDKALCIELFQQEIRPAEQKDDILKEAHADADAIKKQAYEKLKVAMASDSRAAHTVEIAQQEASEILVKARRQYEENIRAAIEEALKEETDLKNKIFALQDEVNSLNEKRALAFAAYEEEDAKRADLETSIEAAQRDYEQSKLELKSALKELNAVKSEQASTQSELERCLLEVKQAREDMQKALESQRQHEKMSIDLTEKNVQLTREVAEVKDNLGKLRETEQRELQQVQKKAELEYERQKALEHARMTDRLEYENKLRRLRQIQDEKIENERRSAQVDQISHDIFQQLSMHMGFRVDDQKLIRSVVEKSIHDEYHFRQSVVSKFESTKFRKFRKLKIFTSAAAILLFLGAIMIFAEHFKID